MNKILHSFRMHIIYSFIKSLLLSALITFGLYKVLQLYYHYNVYYGDTYMYYRQLMRQIGDVYVFLVIYIPLAILIFYILTRTYTNYFNEISQGIHHLANGDFSHQVTIDSTDEFNKIAKDLNEASSRLKQAIEAEKLSKSSKEALIANLAHDLRTPLTSVIGYLDLLQNNKGLTSNQLAEYTKIANTKALYLEELIEALFDISKLDLTLEKSEKTPINMQELLFQLLDEMYPMIEEANAQIENSIDSNLITFGNGKELARVFENLLVNAIRYGNNRTPIKVSAHKKATSLVIQMSNSGERIADDDLLHLFDMFYTVDQSRNFEKKQTGLGLYIAKTIVEKHKGTIRVWNGEEQIHFEVTLPSYE